MSDESYLLDASVEVFELDRNWTVIRVTNGDELRPLLENKTVQVTRTKSQGQTTIVFKLPDGRMFAMHDPGQPS